MTWPLLALNVLPDDVSFPVEGNAGRERRGEQVRQRDDDLVRIVGRGFHIEKAFAAGASGCFIRLCLVTMPWMVRAI